MTHHADTPRAPVRSSPLRRHHRRRHGAAVVHAADPHPSGRRGRRRSSSADGIDPAWWCTPSRWAPTSRSSWSTGRRTRGRPVHGAASSSGSTRCCREGGQRRDPDPAASPGGRGRCMHRHRRPHRRHRRDPQHQGLRGREGAGVLPGVRRGEPRRPGCWCRIWSVGAGRHGRRRAWSPRWSPSGTPTCTTPGRWSAPSGGLPRRRSRPLLVVGGPRFDETATADLGVDRIFGRGTTPGEVASYLVTPWPTGAEAAR